MDKRINMTNALLAISDCNIALYQQGECQYTNSGYATVTDSQLVFGEEAEHLGIHHPLNAYCHFWQDMSQSELSNPQRHLKTQADLVYAQLQHIKSFDKNESALTTELHLLVPSHYQHEQLSLLLGICEAAAYRPVQADDYGALLLSRYYAPHTEEQTIVLIDVQQHQTVVSEYVIQSHVTLKNCHVIAKTGRCSFLQAMMQTVANEFIRQKRFDPLHSPNSHSQLYQVLTQHLLDIEAGTQHASEALTINLDGHSVTISIDTLQQGFMNVFPALSDGLARHGDLTHDVAILAPSSSWLLPFLKKADMGDLLDITETVSPEDQQHLLADMTNLSHSDDVNSMSDQQENHRIDGPIYYRTTCPAVGKMQLLTTKKQPVVSHIRIEHQLYKLDNHNSVQLSMSFGELTISLLNNTVQLAVELSLPKQQASTQHTVILGELFTLPDQKVLQPLAMESMHG